MADVSFHAEEGIFLSTITSRPTLRLACCTQQLLGTVWGILVGV